MLLLENHGQDFLLLKQICSRELMYKKQVEIPQDRAQLALAHYVSQHNPHNPAR